MPCLYLFGHIPPYVAVYSHQQVLIVVVSCIRETFSVLILFLHIIQKDLWNSCICEKDNVSRYSATIQKMNVMMPCSSVFIIILLIKAKSLIIISYREKLDLFSFRISIYEATFIISMYLLQAGVMNYIFSKFILSLYAWNIFYLVIWCNSLYAFTVHLASIILLIFI